MNAVLPSSSSGLRADYSQRAVVTPDAASWQHAPADGIARLRLERIGDDPNRATSFVRFAPGARFMAPDHGNGEEILVLAGVFADERGLYPAGTYLRNPPGSHHAPYSPSGCTLFVKLRAFSGGDTRSQVTDLRDARWERGRSDQASRVLLHRFDRVRTSLLHWRPGIGGAPVNHPGGAEIVVLDGAFGDEYGEYRPGSWLRLPAGTWHRPRAGRSGLLVWLKTGHLGATDQQPDARREREQFA